MKALKMSPDKILVEKRLSHPLLKRDPESNDEVQFLFPYSLTQLPLHLVCHAFHIRSEDQYIYCQLSSSYIHSYIDFFLLLVSYSTDLHSNKGFGLKTDFVLGNEKY